MANTWRSNTGLKLNKIDTMEATDYLHIKYQADPERVIRDCLGEKNPTAEVEFAITALSVLGLKKIAAKVIEACPKYGIKLEFIYESTNHSNGNRANWLPC